MIGGGGLKALLQSGGGKGLYAGAILVYIRCPHTGGFLLLLTITGYRSRRPSIKTSDCKSVYRTCIAGQAFFTCTGDVLQLDLSSYECSSPSAVVTFFAGNLYSIQPWNFSL
eukprot:scaffold23000_cov29-Tisochrysis_lutea.AAC.2